MESEAAKNQMNRKSIPARRRGEVKVRIFGHVAKSMVSVVNRLTKKRDGNDGGCLSSGSASPHQIPSGYNSDS